jgi:hypothetical protein
MPSDSDCAQPTRILNETVCSAVRYESSTYLLKQGATKSFGGEYKNLTCSTLWISAVSIRVVFVQPLAGPVPTDNSARVVGKVC